MYKFIVYLIFLLGSALHIYFLQINQVLKVPDSYAYLQMANFFKNFSIDGFGTGWFGFLYSLPIGITNLVIDYLGIHSQDNLFLSAQIVNIICLVVSGILIFIIGKMFLNKNYNILLLILFFLSPILINYNIGILSENIYIPLFLGFFLLLNKLIVVISTENFGNEVNKSIFFVSLMLALLYFTRGEAFIYLGSIFIILFVLLIKKDLSFLKFLKFNFLIVIFFLLLISPYIYYLHSITGEWGLTNKGDSNLRQAKMRGVYQMDDAGFEKSVGELTQDKHHFIHGFIGGLKYDKPTSSTGGLVLYIKDNPDEFINRFLVNQKKLYTKNLPNIIIGESFEVYRLDTSYFYKSKFYLGLLLLPLVLLLYGIISLILAKEDIYNYKINFIIITFSTFLTASLFFTIFFLLDRYFIVFLPFFLIVICYGVQRLMPNLEEKSENFRLLKYLIITSIFISIFVLGNKNYFTSAKFDDEKYVLKKEAGLLLKDKLVDTSNLKIMERFPVFTYYIGSKQRRLTPYTDKLEDLIEYAKYNKIDYLVVDTMDFEKYRPGLKFLLDYEKKHKGLELFYKNIKPGKKVLIYKIEK